MAVTSLNGYVDTIADDVNNFHGNQLVYIGWDKHLMFCSSTAYPLPPEMPFGAIIQEVIPGTYGVHPQFSEINWESVQWLLNNEPFKPDPEASLKDNGIGHKCSLRFITPGLDGVEGSGN
jgi:phenol hydroxylase P4 protein